MKRRHALRDDQWEWIKDILPGQPNDVGVTAKNNRLFVEAVLYRYKARHLIENFFAKIKQYRAIATHYDKLACHFLSAIHLVSCVIWLNWWHALTLFLIISNLP